MTRDVPPDAVADLAAAPPRATLAWVDDGGAVVAAAVDAASEGDRWHVHGGERTASAGLGGREVVLVADDGPGWFQLRALLVRGVASVVPGDPLVHLRTRRVVSWDYGALRPASGDDPAPTETSGDSQRRKTVARDVPRAAPPALAATDRLGAPPTLPQSARRVLRRSRVLLLATVSARGRPFCVPLWFVHHRGRFWIATGAESWSARNTAANPQVCLLLGAERGQPRTRVRVAGEAVPRPGLPPVSVLLRLALRYYLAPPRAVVEVRHARQWLARQRYYRQTAGGAAYLVVTPTAVEAVTATT